MCESKVPENIRAWISPIYPKNIWSSCKHIFWLCRNHVLLSSVHDKILLNHPVKAVFLITGWARGSSFQAPLSSCQPHTNTSPWASWEGNPTSAWPHSTLTSPEQMTFQQRLKQQTRRVIPLSVLCRQNTHCAGRSVSLPLTFDFAVTM